MNTKFLIAFGGPVLIGVIGFGITVLIRPRQRLAARADTSLASVVARITEAEHASRQTADELAEIRQQLSAR